MTLLIDTPYLCHRAWHAIGDLSNGDRATGTIYGVLRDVATLREEFKPDRCVFAFDLGRSKRHEFLPTYKATRRARHAAASTEERASRQDLQRQIRVLRCACLPAAGFNNVLAAHGYEADDIIASIAAALPDDEEGIIIGSDKDLWQCLRLNVWCWNPSTKRAYTINSFRKAWGIEPAQWAKVKAYAGCPTDDIAGLVGIGEITAARWLRGELGAHTKAWHMLNNGAHIYQANLSLTHLPFPGTPIFNLADDTITEEKWQALAEELGMPSLAESSQAAPNNRPGRKRKARRKGFGLSEGGG